MKIAIIAAAAENGAIGKGGAIPWHLPADFKHFKELTMGHPIIMGRKTYESIGKPLPGRKNIVISNNVGYTAEGCTVVHSLGEALRAAEETSQGEAGKAFVIGGAKVYAETIGKADELYLTRVKGEFDGDVFFPAVDESKWRLISKEAHEKDENNPFDFTFLHYEKN